MIDVGFIDPNNSNLIFTKDILTLISEEHRPPHTQQQTANKNVFDALDVIPFCQHSANVQPQQHVVPFDGNIKNNFAFV